MSVVRGLIFDRAAAEVQAWPDRTLPPGEGSRELMPALC
jgi:hypothetical protein